MTTRRALVTGGSRGIGAAIATALAADGWTVAVHGRTPESAARTRPPGSGHAAVAGDLADPAQVRSMVRAAVSALGGVDLLVNNAAAHAHQPVDATGYDEWVASWSDVVAVNLLGTANVTWCVVDHLLHRPEGPAGGRIITVGSRGAYRGEPTALAYGATKAGVHAFTQSLAVALAPHGIASAAVAPGFVATDMAKEMLEGPAGDGIRAQSPFARVAEPAEVAAAVTWLASPAAVWASGAVLDLNGASHLR
ncbi:SDR family NAD(P)-dependent oxidoreductase [Rhizomonospora bruguierae]|uniref:SDR family NAD(P)-dependent oxidoreductase n=1 Tax=Rhizomonospora bruguierae TaxID=1581705 RepID=UPI001BD183BD|nr:SDR family oxidoreductase [Micromonospora sp. NBRC 107566]